MSLREIDLQAETYYDCENGVYDLFTQYDIDFEHYKLSHTRCELPLVENVVNISRFSLKLFLSVDF